MLRGNTPKTIAGVLISGSIFIAPMLYVRRRREKFMQAKEKEHAAQH